jgi:ABC-type multidrug transport system ATPase subunit
MLTAKGITKEYPSGGGIFDASFSVPDGEIMAVVGPNGAGKSTLFNTIAGIVQPESGECRLSGVSVDRLKPLEFGFLPESDYLIPNFTPLQMLLYVNQMKDLHLNDDKINGLIEEFKLGGFANKKNNSLSQGMRKRVALACTLMGSPKLLILDEPTNGLDTQSTIVLKKAIKESAAQKAVVLISGHVLDFLDKVADEAIFLERGRIIDAEKTGGSGLEEIYENLYISPGSDNA